MCRVSISEVKFLRLCGPSLVWIFQFNFSLGMRHWIYGLSLKKHFVEHIREKSIGKQWNGGLWHKNMHDLVDLIFRDILWTLKVYILSKSVFVFNMEKTHKILYFFPRWQIKCVLYNNYTFNLENVRKNNLTNVIFRLRLN